MGILGQWLNVFFDNYMVLNSKKCHCMWLGKNNNNDKFWFDNLCLQNSNEEVILGVTIDNKLTFDSRIKIYVEKLLKNFIHYGEYLIISKLFSMDVSNLSSVTVLWSGCSLQDIQQFNQ